MNLPSTGIVFTHTDESSGLSAAHFMPIVRIFFKPAGIEVVERDISLTTRILQVVQAFKVNANTESIGIDALAQDIKNGVMVVKSPNISATKEQVVRAILELRTLGFTEEQVPNYPEEDHLADRQQAIKSLYDRQVIGSVVNPAMRRGNSVRGLPPSVKQVAQQVPHAYADWKADSKTHVRFMESGDFSETEKSASVEDGQTAMILFVDDHDQETILARGIKFEMGLVDVAVMDRAQLRAFYDQAHKGAKEDGLAIAHMLKTTMMVASDGPAFSEAVASYYANALDKHRDTLDILNANPADGIASLIRKLDRLEEPRRLEILRDLQECRRKGPLLPLLDMETGKLHLDNPSDVLVDAAMANLARWARMRVKATDGSAAQQDVMAVIPDRTYGKMFAAAINDLKKHGAINPAAAGSIVNVGLMAPDKYGIAAEEYGTKPTTFAAHGKGTIRTILERTHETLFAHPVQDGDIYRLARTSTAAIADWADLTIQQAKKQSPQEPALFLLDVERAHDQKILTQIRAHLAQQGYTEGVDFRVLSPEVGIVAIHDFMRNNKDGRLIVGTGNVLRDYLTDWTPVLEAGSSNMLTSQVGTNLHETGAGGTAPDLMQNALSGRQFKWSSMGEYLATAEALRGLEVRGNKQAGVLARTLDEAIKDLLAEEGPLPKIDTRYQQGRLAQLWAGQLVNQMDDMDLAVYFKPLVARFAEVVPAMKKELSGLNDKPDPAANDDGVYFGLSQRPGIRAQIMRSRLMDAVKSLAAL